MSLPDRPARGFRGNPQTFCMKRRLTGHLPEKFLDVPFSGIFFMEKNTAQNNNLRRKIHVSLPVLALILLAVFLVSFMLGRYGVSVVDVLKVFANKLMELIWLAVRPLSQLFGAAAPELPGFKDITPEITAVVINIRLPRILMACLVGCCLSCAGASYQGVFQNPMASPDILGASNGAAFGAALSIILGLGSRMTTVLAFGVSLVTVAVVFFIAQRAPGHRVMNLILAGIMIGSFFSAGTSYIKLVADPSNQLPEITYWLMGSLAGVKLGDFNLIVLLAMIIGCGVIFVLRWKINLLTLGDEEARSLGVNTTRLRLLVIFAATLVTAASIAVSGVIGWVGLVIPHITRKLVGSNYRKLIPASMLTGAIFMLLVDDVSRNLLASEIPIGILTAFVGAPFFVYLLIKREKTL